MQWDDDDYTCLTLASSALCNCSTYERGGRKPPVVTRLLRCEFCGSGLRIRVCHVSVFAWREIRLDSRMSSKFLKFLNNIILSQTSFGTHVSPTRSPFCTLGTPREPINMQCLAVSGAIQLDKAVLVAVPKRSLWLQGVEATAISDSFEPAWR